MPWSRPHSFHLAISIKIKGLFRNLWIKNYLHQTAQIWNPWSTDHWHPMLASQNENWSRFRRAKFSIIWVSQAWDARCQRMWNAAPCRLPETVQESEYYQAQLNNRSNPKADSATARQISGVPVRTLCVPIFQLTRCLKRIWKAAPSLPLLHSPLPCSTFSSMNEWLLGFSEVLNQKHSWRSSTCKSFNSFRHTCCLLAAMFPTDTRSCLVSKDTNSSIDEGRSLECSLLSQVKTQNWRKSVQMWYLAQQMCTSSSKQSACMPCVTQKEVLTSAPVSILWQRRLFQKENQMFDFSEDVWP